MKRSISLTIVTAMILIMVSLFSSDNTTHAQNQVQPVADTGFITLGENQVIRVGLHAGDLTSFDRIRVRLRKLEYAQSACAGGVCKLALSSQTLSDITVLMPDEAASFEISNSAFGVRAVIESPDQKVRVNAFIVNAATGDVVSYIDLNDPSVPR